MRTTCTYDRWDKWSKSKCAIAAGFIARTPKERLLCDVHASVAYALGWPVTAIDLSGIPELQESEHA